MQAGRLTWNPHAPAPFESAWAIFVKIEAHNYLKIGELATLLRRQGVTFRRQYWFDPRSSDWIDFDKFGHLLNVDPARLTTGFLDRLGFVSNPNSYRRYEVRHCPQCAALGYHCALFDLELVAECPWHHVPLVAPCRSCAALLDTNNAFPFVAQDRLSQCRECGMPLTPFFDRPELNKLPADLEQTIIGHCAELVDWWRTVRTAANGFKEATAKLEGLVGNDDHEHMIPPILLGYAQTAAPARVNWKFSVPAWPARCAEWISPILGDQELEQEFDINDATGKIYRSIRRHLYRKYVRPHRRCLAALMSLDRDMTFALRGDTVCVVALTYLVWRMSIEGICNIEGRNRSPCEDFAWSSDAPKC